MQNAKLEIEAGKRHQLIISCGAFNSIEKPHELTSKEDKEDLVLQLQE
jgi:hypothetical protein